MSLQKVVIETMIGSLFFSFYLESFMNLKNANIKYNRHFIYVFFFSFCSQDKCTQNISIALLHHMKTLKIVKVKFLLKFLQFCGSTNFHGVE